MKKLVFLKFTNVLVQIEISIFVYQIMIQLHHFCIGSDMKIAVPLLSLVCLKNLPPISVLSELSKRSKYSECQLKLYLCFVDFRKAQDSIWREALFYKLSAYYGVSTNFIDILDNMCNKVHLSVRLPNDIAQSFSSNIGLKQGCNLRPILFSIFINDLNEIFDKTFWQPAKIKNLTLNNLLYADYLVLIFQTSSGLQTASINGD